MGTGVITKTRLNTKANPNSITSTTQRKSETSTRVCEKVLPMWLMIGTLCVNFNPYSTHHMSSRSREVHLECHSEHGEP